MKGGTGSAEFKMNKSWFRKLIPYTDAYLEKLGTQMESDSRAIVPVDTGELRDSIFHEVSEGELVLGARAEHALAVELGTSKMAAQPYLRPVLYKKRR